MTKQNVHSPARDVVAAALAVIESRDGRLTPERVVEAASDVAHPLHTCFTWDDTVAAHRWRLEQARTLIRGVKVTITTADVVVRTVAYVRDPTAPDREQGYASVEALRSDPEAALKVLDYEVRHVLARLARVQMLAAAFGLEDEVSSVRLRVRALVDRVAATTVPPAS